MNKIEKECIRIPELVSIIIGEFSFMETMDICDKLIRRSSIPPNLVNLRTLQIDALLFFVKLTKYGELTNELDVILDFRTFNIELAIGRFLYPYRNVFDTEAMRQNIHNKINQLP